MAYTVTGPLCALASIAHNLPARESRALALPCPATRVAAARQRHAVRAPATKAAGLAGAHLLQFNETFCAVGR